MIPDSFERLWALAVQVLRWAEIPSARPVGSGRREVDWNLMIVMGLYGFQFSVKAAGAGGEGFGLGRLCEPEAEGFGVVRKLGGRLASVVWAGGHYLCFFNGLRGLGGWRGFFGAGLAG